MHFAPLFALFAQLAAVVFVEALPVTLPELKAADILALKPYARLAAITYCPINQIKQWTCAKCKDEPFDLIASGGNGATVQNWFVGWDKSLKKLIVAYEGTVPTAPASVITDLKFTPKPLRRDLFPDAPADAMTHNGFGDAHAASAKDVLRAVKAGMGKYKTKSVTVVGHSLGAGIAIIESGQLAAQIPGAKIETIAFSSPRVGNPAFAKYVSSRAKITRINNMSDPVPELPGRTLLKSPNNFVHAGQEIHVTSEGKYVKCPTESENPQCTNGYLITMTDLESLKSFQELFAHPKKLWNPLQHQGPFADISIFC
ncbi:hypothetical protein D9611_012729 [Ephemerocybe angulata]|uniref:Fungal lipase-type domain-containing protein n=1 Tax=Ephemerocybe angulata TaxID=980116 RepID=A0A8H5B993_9AGAR|nr:hypothetical protein D9611_012729 [Tulosesus angulatus]